MTADDLVLLHVLGNLKQVYNMMHGQKNIKIMNLCLAKVRISLPISIWKNLNVSVNVLFNTFAFA